MDANFQLRQQDVSSEGKDPSYSNRWSYFVPKVAYKSHLKTFDGKVTQSVCIQVSINVKSLSNPNCSRVYAPTTRQSMQNEMERVLLPWE
jgi:hypothetical protein